MLCGVCALCVVYFECRRILFMLVEMQDHAQLMECAVLL